MTFGFAGTKRYRVVRPLGAGGMGEVYEVEDRASGARVALKLMLTDDPRRLLRFKQEFRLMAELHHPNLVRLFDLATEDGRWFFTMELVTGQDLLRVLVERGDELDPFAVDAAGSTAAPLAATADDVDIDVGPRPAPPVAIVGRRPPACEVEPLLAVLAQLLDALEFLHGHGVVHRDLKPSNVLVDLDGRVRVLDFGLVSRIDRVDAISQDGVMVGTLAYMSPEQLDGGAATPASDRYALGCVLFQLLTGALPFGGGLAGALAGRAKAPPRVDAVVDGVSPILVDVVQRLMAVAPDQRPDLAAVRAALGLAPGPSAARTDRLAIVPASGDRFVGRAAEVATLTACLDAALAGQTQLALVSGGSGIGKTALADELIRRASARGFGCFRGRSYEREQVPFVAFDRVVDAITVALQRWPRDRLAPLAPALRALARIFPALGLLTGAGERGEPADDADAIDPRELRGRAFDGFARLLGQWQAEQPLLLVLDDLQWADDESLALLEAVLARGAARLAILALARDGAGARAHPLAALVRRLGLAAGQVVTVALTAMPVAEAVEIVDSVGGGRLDADTARALADHAGGNPFLVRRLAEHLAGLAPDARAAVLDAAGSSDDVLREMIGALSPRAEQLLALAAAAGGDVPGSLLRDTSGLSAADFDLAAGELMAARFLKAVPAAPAYAGRARGTVDDSPRVDLYHDRIREVVYRGLADERRRALHRGLAVTLQATASDDGHDAEALARHWGEAGDRVQRRRFALEAAELAATKLAFRRAAELLRVVQADPEPDEPTVVGAARWERIGVLHEYGGDLASAGAAFGEALARWDAMPAADGAATDALTARCARLRLRARAGCCLMAAGELARGQALFAAGLASLGLPLERSLLGRVTTLVALTARERLAGPDDGRGAVADPWLATRVRFFDLTMRAFQIVLPLVAAEAALRCALLGRRAGDHDARVNALAFSAAAPASQRRCSPAELARAGQKLDAAEAIARGHAVPLGREIVQLNRAMVWLPTDPTRARKASESALAGLARLGMVDSYEGNRARGQHLFVLYCAGDHDELLAAAEREIATRDNNLMTVAVAYLGQTRVWAARGDLDRAAGAVRALQARVPEQPVTALQLLGCHAEVALRVAEGRFADALALAAPGERAARLSGAWPVGLLRTSWIDVLLEAAIGLARRGELAPAARRRAARWAGWMARHGVFGQACLGDRAHGLLAHAAGPSGRAHAVRAIDRAIARSAAGAIPHHRWLCLEAARDVGRLNLDLEAEAAELAARGRYVLPPGWRVRALGEGAP